MSIHNSSLLSRDVHNAKTDAFLLTLPMAMHAYKHKCVNSFDVDCICLVCLSVYLCVCLSICLSICLSVCLFVYLFVCLFVCLSGCLSGCLSVCLSIKYLTFFSDKDFYHTTKNPNLSNPEYVTLLNVYLSVCLCICVSVSLPVGWFVGQFVCLLFVISHCLFVLCVCSVGMSALSVCRVHL